MSNDRNDRWEEIKIKFANSLIERRKIYLGGDIEGGLANQVGKMILYLNSKGSEEISLVINSDGGSVSAGLDIYDVIRYSPAPVNGIVYRRANSMATVILQGCAKRIAMPHAVFAFHKLQLSISGDWDELEETLKNKTDEMRKYQDELYKILSFRSRLEIEKIKEICKKKMTLSAVQMKNLGLIDEIVNY